MQFDFDWQEAGNDGHVVFNAPGFKQAVFADTGGCITIFTEELGRQTVINMDVDKALSLIQKLASALHEAIPIEAEVQNTYDARLLMTGVDRSEAINEQI
jgi:hypothetical protein